MKLYFAPQTRATRPRWMLEELEIPYELVRLDLKKGEHKTPEYLKIHPLGAVPALVDGETTLIESAAILMYLADKFPEKGLAPAVGSPERGHYYQWMLYTMVNLEPPVLDVFQHTVMLPEGERKPEVVDAARAKWEKVMAPVEATLEGKTWLLGEQFTAADVLLGSITTWANFMGLLAGFPNVIAYNTRVSARPGFRRGRAP